MDRPGTLLRLIALASTLTACAHPPNTGDSAPTAVSLPTPGIDQVRWMTPLATYVGERSRCIERELGGQSYADVRDRKLNTFFFGGLAGRFNL